MHVEQDPAAPTVPFGKGAGLRLAQLDQGKFGGDEETVQQDQQECRAYVEQVL